jgi:hypothetical protein
MAGTVVACEGVGVSKEAVFPAADYGAAASSAALAEPAAAPFSSEGGFGRERNEPAFDRQRQQGQAQQGQGQQGQSNPGQTPPVSAPQQNIVSQTMLIRNGSVVIVVDSLETAMEAVRALATNLGGYIGNVAVAVGNSQVHSASLQVKIPAARFDEAMAGMGTTGKLERSNATAHDVTEEFVDVTARIANGKRMEERLVVLLAARTGTLEDALAVERELARVRQEVERLEGRIRFLSAHVATSTIDVNLREKGPLINRNPGSNVIGQAFLNSWRNFVFFVARAIESLGVLLPLCLVGYGIFRLLRRLSKKPS